MRPAQAAAAEPSVLHVDLSTDGASAKSLNLPFGKSAIVDLPADVRDVLVTNPAVADAVLRVAAAASPSWAWRRATPTRCSSTTPASAS